MPIVSEGVVYCVTTTKDDDYRTYLVAVDLASGKLLWRLDSGEDVLGSWDNGFTPCLSNGVLYVQANGEIVALK